MIAVNVKVKKGLSQCFDACAHVIDPPLFIGRYAHSVALLLVGSEQEAGDHLLFS